MLVMAIAITVTILDMNEVVVQAVMKAASKDYGRSAFIMFRDNGLLTNL